MDEARQQRPWPVRAQAPADALKAAAAKRDGLRTDLEAAKAAVLAIATELAAAESEWAAAQAGMEAVQAEASQGAEPQQGVSRQDAEVLGVLREMVTATGVPVQNLLTALYTVISNQATATAAAAAAGLGAARAPGGGLGGPAAGGAQASDVGGAAQAAAEPAPGMGRAAAAQAGTGPGLVQQGLAAAARADSQGAGAGAPGAGRRGGGARASCTGGQTEVKVATDLAVGAVRHSWLGAAARCLTGRSLTVLEGVNRARRPPTGANPSDASDGHDGCGVACQRGRVRCVRLGHLSAGWSGRGCRWGEASNPGPPLWGIG